MTATASRFDRRLLAPMVLGSILNPINSSIIAVALVPIAAAFGAPLAQTALLVSSLYVATAIGQPLVGRLVDLFGPRRLFLVGTALTGVAGLLGALAPALPVLVAARVVLGFGTCAGYPASMVLIKREAQRTGRDSPAGVLTALAIATQTVAVVGPSLGGLLIELGGWRATFAVNVPLSLAGIVLGAAVLPRDARGAGLRGLARLDWAGVLLLSGTLVALLGFLLRPRVAALGLLAAAVVLAAAFAWRELRAHDPFVDVRVLAHSRPLLATFVRSLLGATVSYAFLYGFTQWLEDGRGLTPSLAGLVLLPTFGVGLIVSAATGRRPEVRRKLLVGAVVQAVVCALLLGVGPDEPVWGLVGIAALLGVPQGLVNLGNQNALYAQADPAALGASSGLLRTFMYLGAITASSASGAFFGARADTAGLHGLAVFMLVAAVLLTALVLADRALARVGRPASS